MTELDQSKLVFFDEFEGKLQKPFDRAELLERVPMDGIGVRLVEITTPRLVGGYDDHVRGVESLDEAPVVRLSAADTWREIVRDE